MASFESDLAHQFAPTYHASQDERNYLVELEPQHEPEVAKGHPPSKPYVYFSVVELGRTNGELTYEINYLAIWDWDSGSVVRDVGGSQLGFGAHEWDIERVAILVAGPEDSREAQSYRMRQAYFGAHERVRVAGLLSVDNSRYVTYAPPRKRGPDVWWSKGKHASFRSLKDLEASTAGDHYEAPGVVAEPGACSLVDAGTLEQPSRAAPWITYKKRWGPHRIPPVYARLKDRLWDATGAPLRDIWQATDEGIKQIQAELGVPQTGQLDRQTLQQATAALPPDMLWAVQEEET